MLGTRGVKLPVFMGVPRDMGGLNTAGDRGRARKANLNKPTGVAGGGLVCYSCGCQREALLSSENAGPKKESYNLDRHRT